MRPLLHISCAPYAEYILDGGFRDLYLFLCLYVCWIAHDRHDAGPLDILLTVRFCSLRQQPLRGSFAVAGSSVTGTSSLRVQVPNYKVSTKNHNYDSEYGNPKYPIVRYFGPLWHWYYGVRTTTVTISELPPRALRELREKLWMRPDSILGCALSCLMIKESGPKIHNNIIVFES